VVLLGIFLFNYQFIGFVMSSDLFNFFEKIALVWSTVGGYFTLIPLSTQISLFLVGIFTALNVSFFIYYVKRRVVKQRSAGVGTLGIVIGFIGMGCGACGSVILSALVGVTASSQVIGILPFEGLEFSVVGILMLLGSTLFLAKKIQDPQVCPVVLRG
jgi:hypothetical protein